MIEFNQLLKVVEIEEVFIPERRYILSNVSGVYEIYDKNNMRVIMTWKPFKTTTREEVIEWVTNYYGKHKVLIK